MEWFLIAGVLLVAVALVSSLVEPLPLSVPVVYLLVGVALGPWALGLLDVDPVGDAALVEHVTEVAVTIALFGAGLSLRLPLRPREWSVPLRLAFLSMTLTVGLIALAGHTVLGLSAGAAILLGAVLAPTDPVLAGEVQVRNPFDRDALRRGLTAEAGLNDGTAFPFVMLGLGLIGAGSLGPGGSRWLAVDVAWAVLGGLAIGAAVAWVVARVVLHVRRTHRRALGLDEFLALGIVALAYGAALGLHAYGFLAAFAAGVTVRQIERREMGEDPPEEARSPDETLAAHPEHAPAYMAHALLEHNAQLERIGELALVVLVGAMLATAAFSPEVLLMAGLVLLVARPVAVAVGLAGAPLPRRDRALIGWFGVRGIGSVYYLAYAAGHGLLGADADVLAAVTLATIALSIVVHGISVTPLLERRRRVRPEADAGEEPVTRPGGRAPSSPADGAPQPR